MPRPAARVLVYVQHLLGTGHLRRAAVLARETAALGLEVTLVSGGAPEADLDVAPARLVQLPPVRALDESFAVLVDEAGTPIDDAWRERRRRLLLEAWRRAAPDVLVIELFPFGRRKMRFELLPLLEAAAAAAPRPAVVCSVRDILVAKRSPARFAETADLVERYFDLVLVHGDPRLVAFGRTFPPADRIADRLRYTGYVADRRRAPAAEAAAERERAGVVVSAGGGPVGEALLGAALAARPLTRLADRPWRFLVARTIAEPVFARLREAAPPGVLIERARPDFPRLLAAAELSISQAGYNTVVDLLQAETRAVLVPFAAGGESEQTLRARLLAERGLVGVVEEPALGPAALAEAVEAALRRPPPARDALDLSGGETAARLIAALARNGTGGAAAREAAS